MTDSKKLSDGKIKQLQASYIDFQSIADTTLEKLKAALIDRLSFAYTEEEAARWLWTSHPMLYGATPMSAVMKHPEALDKVLEIIEQLETGAHA